MDSIYINWLFQTALKMIELQLSIRENVLSFKRSLVIFYLIDVIGIQVKLLSPLHIHKG